MFMGIMKVLKSRVDFSDGCTQVFYALSRARVHVLTCVHVCARARVCVLSDAGTRGCQVGGRMFAVSVYQVSLRHSFDSVHPGYIYIFIYLSFYRSLYNVLRSLYNRPSS